MSNLIDQFPWPIVHHCFERLCDRYGINGHAKAQTIYLTHHGQLVRGEGELLYKKEEGLVFRVESGGRYYYPVRAMRDGRIVTVTYLSESQVLRSIVALYVLENAEERHGMSKRGAA